MWVGVGVLCIVAQVHEQTCQPVDTDIAFNYLMCLSALYSACMGALD